MTENEMRDNRLTKHYEDFVNGAFVNVVELVTYPLVQQTDDDQFRFPPWDQNLIRLELRLSIMNLCWFWGFYDLLFSVEVQAFYDCMTWLNTDWLAFQDNWCFWFFCERKKQLYRGFRR